MPNRTWLSAKDFQRSKLVTKRKDLPPPSPVLHIIKDGKVLEPKTLRRILTAAETQLQQISGDAHNTNNRIRMAESLVTALRATVRSKDLPKRLIPSESTPPWLESSGE